MPMHAAADSFANVLLTVTLWWSIYEALAILSDTIVEAECHAGCARWSRVAGAATIPLSEIVVVTSVYDDGREEAPDEGMPVATRGEIGYKRRRRLYVQMACFTVSSILLLYMGQFSGREW